MQGMDMSSSSNSTAECQISMLFNWHTIDACFLSSGWHIKNNGMFAATCIGVILLVILVEGFRRLGKEYDLFLARQFQRQAAARSTTAAKNRDRAGEREALCQTVLFRVTPLQQLVRAVIHAVTFGGAYIIMLLAMYFNVYVIICIFIGAGLGKFLCDWMVVRVDLETVQGDLKGVEETTICCG
ncbi:Ctr copper transporter [Penicillium macrosclerotiorum]|uniref:Ctr copper transporter n=1 Tax=Penicillium macrosclerotiorum TaxID=303699 RepID=UPI002549AC2E|nr:Ctr copper transporter [Penicillium macrosclerotiorum]KAJ5669819.1 Ctr copper transporter [Penicillium macrosclerotiorum]